MATVRLDERRTRALKPRKSTYDIRDRELKGFGVRIMPLFEGRPIAAITAHDVQRWFASLHNTQVAADRSAPILSVIMRRA